MIILGIDPGTHVGWCVLDHDGKRARWVHSDVYTDQNDVLVEHVYAAARMNLRGDESQRIVICAIETPGGGMYSGARSAGVLDCAFYAGRMFQHARQEGSNALRIRADEVRRALIGRPSAKDWEVAAALPPWIDGVPKRTNAHVRDAAAIALVAGWPGSAAPAAVTVNVTRR